MWTEYDPNRQPPRPPGGMFGPSFPFGPGVGPTPPGPGFPGQPSGEGLGVPPTSPPPSFTPSMGMTGAPGFGVFAIDPGAIRPCTFRFVYLWLDNGQQFWAWLVFVGRRSVAGYRWRRNRWVYFGVDLRDIVSFECF